MFLVYQKLEVSTEALQISIKKTLLFSAQDHQIRPVLLYVYLFINIQSQEGTQDNSGLAAPLKRVWRACTAYCRQTSQLSIDRLVYTDNIISCRYLLPPSLFISRIFKCVNVALQTNFFCGHASDYVYEPLIPISLFCPIFPWPSSFSNLFSPLSITHLTTRYFVVVRHNQGSEL